MTSCLTAHGPCVQGMTGRACPVCDQLGLQPYPSNRSLKRHLESVHGRHLCDTCLAVSSRVLVLMHALVREHYAIEYLRSHLQ